MVGNNNTTTYFNWYLNKYQKNYSKSESIIFQYNFSQSTCYVKINSKNFN